MVLPNQAAFNTAYAAGKGQLVWTEYYTDLETPVSALLKLKDLSPHAHLLYESVQGGNRRARYSAIALLPDILWSFDGKTISLQHYHADNPLDAQQIASHTQQDATEPFTSLRQVMQQTRLEIPDALPPIAHGLFGYMGYDVVRFMEQLPNSNPDTIGVPISTYMRPTITLVFDSVTDTAHIVTAVYPTDGQTAAAAYAMATQRLRAIADTLKQPLSMHPPRVMHDASQAAGETTDQTTDPATALHAHTDAPSYHAIVEQAKRYIVAGDVFQVVPSRRFSGDFPHSPLALYRALRHLNPSPYLFYLCFGDMALVGSSPEILVRTQGSTLAIRPIAGTRKRGENAAEDEALEADLLADPKEISEHLMLLDLGRNDVGRVSKSGTVKVTEQMVIERYSHVMHIVSNVEGTLREDVDAIDALIAGFPAGTVSGAPKIRAMEIIDELETERRSFYGGTVGYLSANGDMDTCIALRTALVHKKTLYLQAGGGVVADSDPQAEFMETENKVSALIVAAHKARDFI